MKPSLGALGIREGAGFCSFEVRVTPKSPRNKIAGVRNGKLQMRIQAPPLEGAANACALEFLSDVLKSPLSSIRLVRGARSRDKVLKVVGLNAAQILSSLEKEVT